MKPLFLVSALLVIGQLVLSGCGTKKDIPASARVIRSTDAPAPIGPYSQATQLGNFTFLSGQVALDAQGKMDTSSIEAETHQVMKNLAAVLKAGNIDFNNVIKTTIYLTSLSNFRQVNEIYGSYFTGGNFPARETVQVSALPKGARVEISMIAGN